MPKSRLRVQRPIELRPGPLNQSLMAALERQWDPTTQALHTAAIASISNRKFGLASPRNTQSVLAGGLSAKYS